MGKFSTWSHDVNMGYLESYEPSQTPEETAADIARELTYPTYLAKGANYNLGVQCLSEGADSSMTIPDGHPALHSYMQAFGSHQALTVEVRVPDTEEDYVHYVVAHEPIQNPDSWVPLSWENNQRQIVTVKRHPEEIFTGEQAVPVFRDYIINNQLPPAHLLRRITVQSGSRPARDADAVVQPRSLASPVIPGKRLFNTWTVSRGFGYHPYFMNPQTPEEIANKITQDLSSPLFLAEDSNYAFGVEQLPEGINFPEDIPPERPVQTYIQVGGSYEAMSLEIRVVSFSPPWGFLPVHHRCR